MTYTGGFYSVDNRLYKIEIETTSKGSDQPLTLSGTPFIVNYSAEDSHIYSPIKCGGATIGIITDYYIPDFYTGAVQGVKVWFYEEIGSTDIVRWVGYIAPTAYSQNFDKYLEEIQLDCIDGIAVLKDIPYSFTEVKTIVNFSDIIFNCLKKSDCYKSFYISDNVQLTANGTDSIIDRLKIAQANFFDEKDDANQSDDDVAWSCYDVLFELCQFLGYVMFPDGEDVYIVDYDAIKSGNNTYFKYSLDTTSIQQPSKVTVSVSSHIDANSYAENGTQLSLDEVFNKVTVKDEFNTYEDLFPMFGNSSTERNITSVSDTGCDTKYVLCQDIFVDTDRFGDSNNHQVMLIRSDRNKKNKWRYWFMVWKFMESDVLDFKRYDANKLQINNHATNYSSIQTYNGATYVKYWQKELTYNEQKKIIKDISNLKDSASRKAYWLKLIPYELNWSSMIIGYNGDANHIGPGAYSSNKNYNNGPNQSNWGKYKETWKAEHSDDGIKYDENHCYRLILSEDEDCLKYPFITLKSTIDASIFGGMNAYLLINGSFCYHDKTETPFPLAGSSDNGNLSRRDDCKMPEEGYIWCMLRWGNNWWNGLEWQSTNCNFKLYFWDSTWVNDKDEKRYSNKEIFDVDFKFQNNASKFLEGEEGYYIPVPKNDNLEGTVDFIIYANRDMKGFSKRREWSPKGTYSDNYYSRYYTRVMIIKNLSIIAKVANGRFNDAGNDSDTYYTNVIDNGSVNPMDDITFKVCTYDFKNPTYSSVTYTDGTKSRFVSTLFNKALANEERGNYGCDGTTPNFRQEEHLIYKLVKQYTEPKVVLEVNLKNKDYKLYTLFTDETVSNKKFIVSETEIDYKFNKQYLKLIEKA